MKNEEKCQLKATSLNLIRFFRVFLVTIIIIIDVFVSVVVGIAVDVFYVYIHHFLLTSNYTNCMKIVKFSISQFVYFLLSSSQYRCNIACAAKCQKFLWQLFLLSRIFTFHAQSISHFSLVSIFLAFFFEGLQYQFPLLKYMQSTFWLRRF